MKRVLAEALAIAAVGALLAFAANWAALVLTHGASGIVLRQDYFHDNSTNRIGPVASRAGTNRSPRQILEAQLQQEGLHLADSNLTIQLFRDPRFERDEVIFLDARNDEEYRQGHIPGARLFDTFHPEFNVTNALPLCISAQQVLVYCDGGSCDQSVTAARQLRDVPVIGTEKLLVYTGGLTEWRTNGLPVELGERKSGRIEAWKPSSTEGSAALPQTSETASIARQWIWLASGSLLALLLLGSWCHKTDQLPWRQSLLEAGVIAARWLVGGLFIYTGVTKGLHPEVFLKSVHDYHVVTMPLLLNSIAAALPWFEVFCGLLLVAGVAVRGSAVMLLAMLLPFTSVVLHRALTLYAGTKGVSFCSIAFDCGCGTGKVFICEKLLENGLLVILAAWLFLRRDCRLCARFALFNATRSSKLPVSPASTSAEAETH